MNISHKFPSEGDGRLCRPENELFCDRLAVDVASGFLARRSVSEAGHGNLRPSTCKAQAADPLEGGREQGAIRNHQGGRDNLLPFFTPRENDDMRPVNVVDIIPALERSTYGINTQQ